MRFLQEVFVLMFGAIISVQRCNGILEGWWKDPTSPLKNVEESFEGQLLTSPQEIEVVRYNSFAVNYTLILRDELSECVNLTMTSSPKVITSILPPRYLCPGDVAGNQTVTYFFNTTSEGIVTLETNADPDNIIYTKKAFVSVSAKISYEIDVVSSIVGWIYTVAWDVSFLPQILHNWKRKSVIGLSFDFLTFNLIGFTSYFLFNMGLCWIDGIQDQYYARHPTSVLHVRLNDVIFPLYAMLCVMFQIGQCLIYERGSQRVSTVCRILSGIFLLSIAVFAILVGTVDTIWWLDFLYWLSYIKLAITCIKYAPQLYVNYKHKSTEGWSIWQVILDFTGGALSLLQMFLLAYNYDDFHSIFTDPTKFGLGVLSIFFNIFFFMQHYCLYRHNEIRVPNPEGTEEKEPADKEKETECTVF